MNDLMLIEQAQPVANLYVEPTAWQKHRMKAVPEATLKQVLQNKPMPFIPRNLDSFDAIDIDALTNTLLVRMCSDIPYIQEMTALQSHDEATAFLKKVVHEHLELGMSSQADRIESELERFTNIRFGLPTALRFMNKENILRPDTLVPIEYLPDIFFAAPVWYFNVSDVRTPSGGFSHKKTDQRDREIQKLFCDLIPTQQWADSFLLHNLQIRNLGKYKGDLIPSRILARIKEATPIFDHIVIMTPYHDVVAEEWIEGNWPRPPDPYVVGFKKGVPAFFVLARFSESGVFPLFNELVADSMEFLRTFPEKLRTSEIQHGYMDWYSAKEERFWGSHNNKDKVIEHVGKLLRAFDEGILFPWIRGEKELEQTT